MRIDACHPGMRVQLVDVPVGPVDPAWKGKVVSAYAGGVYVAWDDGTETLVRAESLVRQRD